MTSIIKVDNLQNQCGANIINENAGTITIGASGDTVTLAAGASQSGFGRSGSVNWDTTPKTTGFTAVSGNGYFCDTTSAAFTVTLPATPAAGDIVAIADYNGIALTNNITVGRNSSNINGSAADLTINTNYSAVTLVYVDTTSGWRSVDSSNPNDITTLPEYVAATGGTVTCCGDYKIHTFTGPGTFTVSSAGNLLGSNSVDYLVVAGGGSGGTADGGGGGAGGFRESVPSPAAWTASPLANPGGALPVSVQGYPITVGAGGTGVPFGVSGNAGNVGNDSIFSTITSTGGGGGKGSPGPASWTTGPGGSGGGGGFSLVGGTGNTPPTSPPQGNTGGTGSTFNGAGGGGAGGTGTPGVVAGGAGNAGGPGVSTSISGSPFTKAAGGAGDIAPGSSPSEAANSGNGSKGVCGGGQSTGNGGSGIVVIRYKFQ
jgi:hypothetical protein